MHPLPLSDAGWIARTDWKTMEKSPRLAWRGRDRGWDIDPSGIEICNLYLVESKLAYYWSAALLTIASILLIVLGVVLHARGTALLGAGSALAGAAFTRTVDLARERRAETVRAREARERDLDETRRIAYMALTSRETDRYELVATIVNALAHHGSAVDPDEALRHVTAVVKGSAGKTNESETWLRNQIHRITADLSPGSANILTGRRCHQ
jgi:hypothetical protein